MPLDSIMQIQIWDSEGPLASFSLFAVLHISLFHSVYVWIILCWRILQMHPRGAVLSYREIVICPCYSRKCRFLNLLNLFFPSRLKIFIWTFRNGPATSVSASLWFWLDSSFLFLCLLLLQLIGEFGSHMSLSESSLKLPPSELVSFMVLLFYLFGYNFYEVFYVLEPGPWFSTVLGAH